LFTEFLFASFKSSALADLRVSAERALKISQNFFSASSSVCRCLSS
jgi:hypothetical protein